MKGPSFHVKNDKFKFIIFTTHSLISALEKVNQRVLQRSHQ